MEMFEMIWPALLAVLAAAAAFGWSKLKKRTDESPTKIDDALVKLVEDVVAKRRMEELAAAYGQGVAAVAGMKEKKDAE